LADIDATDPEAFADVTIPFSASQCRNHEFGSLRNFISFPAPDPMPPSHEAAIHSRAPKHACDVCIPLATLDRFENGGIIEFRNTLWLRSERFRFSWEFGCFDYMAGCDEGVKKVQDTGPVQVHRAARETARLNVAPNVIHARAWALC